MTARMLADAPSSDLVRLFRMVEEVNTVGLYVGPLFSSVFLDLMARWQRDGRQESLCSSDENFSPAVIRAIAENLGAITTACLNVIEITAPLLRAREESKAAAACIATSLEGTRVN
jgi:hypothetical protein